LSAPNKSRLDQLLVDRNLVESKNKAQALIMAGQVYVDGERSDKSGRPTPDDAQICVKESFPYVSRGALKLEKAYQEFGMDFEGKTVCDIGSSTGGFSDFSLGRGAKKVYAIDVGTGQLAQKIREDARVIVMEKTDFRDVTLPETIDIFVCDVSFISLKQIIPKITKIISTPVIPAQAGIQETEDYRKAGSQIRSGMTKERNVDIILLIKPQFEAGAKDVSRGKGIIRDPELRQAIVLDIQNYAVNEGFQVAGLVESPITGAKGNVEYLLYLKKEL
jgi:23S rRNA (cytidine1920-2'-O)/16S rRNA (cytidine1409-2'-O)-methyltransferase